jgi:4-amino-4-deoxy-L-arabinose transferase-like glycosyltransferase
MQGLILAAFLLVCLETLFAVPELSWELAVPGHPGLGTALSLAAAVLAAFLVWRGRRPLRARLSVIGERLARIQRGRWLAGVLILGLVLRLAWALAFPIRQTSDAGTYYALGAMLARGEPYVTPLSGTRAEWPPGLPLLLAAAFRLAGIGHPALILLNLALFAGLLFATYGLARRLVGEGAARFATLLVSLWPNLIASAGLATKESVLALALTLSFLLYGAGQDSPVPARRWLARLGAGLALGCAVLSQPAVILLPVAYGVADLAGRVPLRRAVPSWVLLAAGLALVVAPWIVRNQRVLGRPVLSTNGGVVFYRGNNPTASGGYVQGGIAVTAQSELESSDTGYRRGKEWVRENPGKFLRLSLRKQILFLGDDGVGIYETLKRGLGQEGALYAVLKLGASAWWWGLWLLIVLGLVPLDRGKEARSVPSGLLLLLLAFLVLWAIDSVFESGSRHHVPLAGAVAVLAALSLRRDRGEIRPGPSPRRGSPEVPGREPADRGNFEEAVAVLR